MTERHFLDDLDSNSEGLWWLCSCDDVDTGWHGPFADVAERDESIAAHQRWYKVGPVGPDVEPIAPDWHPPGSANHKPTPHTIEDCTCQEHSWAWCGTDTPQDPDFWWDPKCPFHITDPTET